LETFLRSHGIVTKKLNDTEMMTAALDCYMADGAALDEAVQKAYPLLEGAFSCVAMTNDILVAFRDRCGIRPLSIGKLGDGYVVASETCAFDTVGATYVRDVLPGELVVVNEHGLTSHQIVEGTQKLDIFEMVYFARPDSVLLDQRVQVVRENL